MVNEHGFVVKALELGDYAEVKMEITQVFATQHRELTPGMNL